MKKLTISLLVVAMFAIYGIYGKKTPNQTNQSNVSNSPTQTSSSNQTNSFYKDGEYTGNAADAYYGYIQVKATIQNGKIADVQFLQYPNDRHESREINDQAMPILKSEAIQAQSAHVDIVSGATDSSQAFIESLGNALVQAKS